ncbi:MAG: putative DNA binding domain-containing protein [Candidatus Rokubacteria bacterium]|nr:putative DNA binding domain-containing protein [Candidatus Rokubacteria bacterium]
MLDSLEELLRKIRLGEDSVLELKSVRFRGDAVVGPARNDLADDLTAMANTAGGVCVLGVDDRTREIEGLAIERLDAVERLVREVANDAVKPPLLVTIVRLELPSTTGDMRPVLKVDVPRSPFVHRSPGGYFHRLGSSTRELTPELLARLFQVRSQGLVVRFDEQAVPGTSAADLDVERARRHFPPSDSDETALRKLLLVREVDGALRCTVGGLLLFGRDPQQHLPNARIEAVRYRGVRADANYQIDARSCTGPLEDQIAAATAFVEANMRVGATKKPARADLPQFDMRAVFEAIVNAVVHRDYSIYGSKVRLFVFDDRLELYSPGALPNSVTVDTMAVRQATRNELIVRFLSKTPIARVGVPGRVHFVEARGEGVPLILEAGRRVSGREPLYELFDDELRLTIYGRPFEQGGEETAE